MSLTLMVINGKIGGNHKRQTFHFCDNCGNFFGPIGYLNVKYCSKSCVYEDRKEWIPWNKGMKLPQRTKPRKCETCEKVFRPLNEQNGRFGGKIIIRKYCCQRCWKYRKGLITSLITTIRNSNKYAQWRTHVFERDEYICQGCGYGGGCILHAHHIYELAKIYTVQNSGFSKVLAS